MYTADELEIRAALAGSPRADELIACLEGEIAKRDETIARLEPQLNRAIQANYDLREELAACRVAVENCELFRARIVELESRYQRDVYGLNNEGDPIGGDPAGGYANDNARLRTELAALKAQEPSDHVRALNDALTFGIGMIELNSDGKSEHVPAESIYAAPVSEAKAQGVVMPEGWIPLTIEHEPGYPEDVAFGPKRMMDRLKKWLDRYFEMRLNAAPVQQVSMPDISRLLEALERVATLHIIPPYTTPQSSQLMMLKGIADQALESYRAAAPAAPSHGEQVRDALAELLECPASVVQATVPHAGIEAAPPYQVVLDVSVSLTRWKKARAALEAAAPAAPAADAGLVDMYRHLQTVTPYRFKKIQDASVTDGGDVLYFHKDRFDAALLDDMAANCAKESK